MSATGEPAKAQTVKVLLIAENSKGASYLTKRLAKKGCGCDFAVSLSEAASRIRATDYDLVLSATRVHDVSAFVLMDLLESSAATLFYFYAVEEGCWWLPALRRGKSCFGSSALRPSDFAPLLDAVIEDIRASRQAAHDWQPVSRQRSAVSILPPSSSIRESSPAGIPHSGAVLTKHKAAG